MDVTSLIIQVDASAAARGFGQFNASANASAQIALQFASKVDDSMKRSTNSVSMFTIAAGNLIADATKQFITFGIELAKLSFQKTIMSGLEFDDMIRKASISIAAFVQSSNPAKFGDFNTALRVSGEVVDVLRQKMIQFHIPLETLIENFQSVMQSTNGWGLSLNEQIGLTTQFTNALRTLGITGIQANRDIRDILNGMGNRTIAGRMLFSPEDLKKIDASTTTVQQKIAIIQKDLERFSVAGAHGNEVLSYSFDALASMIQAKLGGAVEPLYDTLVAQVNRVRDVINMVDFNSALKPLVDLLKEAAVQAGNLAVALSADPQDFGKLIELELKYAFKSAVEFFVSQIPTIEATLKNSIVAIGPILFDLMFEAAAILTTAIANGITQIKAGTPGFIAVQEASLTAYKANYGAFPPPEYEGQVAAREKYISDLKDARDGKLQMNLPSIQSQYSQFSGSAAQMEKDFAAKFGVKMDKPLVGQTSSEIKTEIDDLWTNKIAPAMNAKQNAALTAQYGTGTVGPDGRLQMGNGASGKLSLAELDLNAHPDATRELNKEQLLAQNQLQTEKDRISLLEAQAGLSQEAIDRAQTALKVDQYRRDLIESGVVDQKQINDLSAAYAQNEANALASKTESAALMKAINVAEKEASDASKKTAQIQQNPFETNLQKRSELLSSYGNEIAALQKIIDLNQAAISSGTLKDQAAIPQRQEEIKRAKEQIEQLKSQMPLQTDAGQFRQSIVQWQNSLGTFGTQAANVVTTTLGSAINSISDNIQKAINGTESWGQAFAKVGEDIVQSLEQVLIKMTVTMALQSALGSMGGAGGGGASGLFGMMMVGAHHGGGIIGSDDPTFTRNISRFHDGGVSSDEQLAVLKKGEGVFTRDQMKAMPNGGASGVHVNIMQTSNPNEISDFLHANPDAIFSAMSRKPALMKQFIRG